MVGIVINIFVMTVILANKQLHTRPFMLCLQVISVNICNIIIYIPAILTSFYQKWLFSSIGCAVLAMASLFFLFWRWLLMFLLIMDRFLMVWYPFQYFKYANTIMKILSISLPLLSITILLVVVMTEAGCYNFTNFYLICTIHPGCSEAKCALPYVLVALLLLLCGIIPAIMYVAMYFKARSIKRKSSDSNNILDTQDGQHSEKRARRTIFIMLVCLLSLTLPSFISNLVIALWDPITTTAIYAFVYIIHNIYSCLPITDAVVILQNSDIKNVVRRMLTITTSQS